MSCFVKMLTLILCSAALHALAEPLPLPFQQSFTGPVLDRAWTIDVSQANTVKATDGGLELTAALNTYAHIQRPLEADIVRARCTLKPGGGISWATSLFLYWDPRNWCQVSVLEAEHNYYAVQLVDGKLLETRRPMNARSDWHELGICLGEDCVRFQARSPGEAWESWLLIERPGNWVGRAPSLLVIGKGFSRDEGEQHWVSPDLDNDYPDRGPRTSSWIRNVSVEATPAAEVRFTQLEKAQLAAAGRDSFGELELASDADPSFDSVARHFPAMKHPQEALGVKDGPDEILVLPNGSLDFKGTKASFLAGDPPESLGESTCARRLFEGCLPIVTTTQEHRDVVYEQTTFGWAPGFDPDKPLEAFVRLQVSLKAGEPRPLALKFAAPEPVVEWTCQMARGKAQSVYVRVPFANPAQARAIGAAEFDEHLAQTAAWWQNLLSQGMQIEVPEPRVNHAWRAWLACNFIDVDKRGQIYEPHDGGGGFYEEIYAYSAARYCHALDLMGYSEDARRYLDSILSFVTPEGLLVLNYGLPDTGAQLWAMAKHFELTQDAAWLRSVAPTMIKMCDWIIATRKSSMAAQSEEMPWHGLIKYKPYCDEPTPAYSYHTDTYLALGMRETARALQGIGLSEPADRIASESDAYEIAILSSMDRSVVERKGMKMLPVFPETRALLERVGYTGADYYSLVASMVLETDLLPATDRRARLITDLLEQKNGLCLGTSAFQDGIDHAYTFGYWMNCLQRHEAKRVILGFYTSLAYGMSRDTYAGVEVTRLRTGENYPTLPHLYSGTQQLLLLRNMLLREEGQDLWIAPAIPRPWLAAGEQVRVQRAPTLFGRLSYAIRSGERAQSMTVHLAPPLDRPPGRIHIRLRHPQGRALREVTVNGSAHRDFTRDTLSLSNIKADAVIQAQFD